MNQLIFTNGMEKIGILNKLERKKKEVEQLQIKLDSYLCTPQTSNLFEKKASLKTELSRMADTTNELLAILKEHNISILDNIENVERQSAEFIKLYEEVELYVKTARK